MLTGAGETFEGGDDTKCPGESNCDDWAQPFDGTYEQKEAAICHGCPKFVSKPSGSSDETAEIDPEEIEEVVNDVADMIFLADGGHETDWNEYPIEIYRLFCEWRRAEKHIAEQRSQFIQSFLKSMCK